MKEEKENIFTIFDDILQREDKEIFTTTKINSDLDDWTIWIWKNNYCKKVERYYIMLEY